MDREKLCGNPGSCPQPSEVESAGATFVLAAPLRPWRVTGISEVNSELLSWPDDDAWKRPNHGLWPTLVSWPDGDAWKRPNHGLWPTLLSWPDGDAWKRPNHGLWPTLVSWPDEDAWKRPNHGSAGDGVEQTELAASCPVVAGQMSRDGCLPVGPFLKKKKKKKIQQ